ncbi:MAG TPA: hypothetical protein VII95_08110 [Terriglobales bacterium]
MKTDASDSDVDVTLIDSFAEHFSLCWQINIHGILPEIRGKRGAFIYCYDEANGLLGVAFIPDELPGDGWNVTCHAMIASGMVLLRDFLSEAYVAFDQKNEKQSRLALAVAGIKPTRDSAEQRAKMLVTITAARKRKAKQLEHQRTLKELSLLRAGVDLTDYDHESDTRWLGDVAL